MWCGMKREFRGNKTILVGADYKTQRRKSQQRSVHSSSQIFSATAAIGCLEMKGYFHVTMLQW